MDEFTILKNRFTVRENIYTYRNGETNSDITLELPGEGFETYFLPEMYDECDDPEDLMREHAAKEFQASLEYLVYGKYRDLDVTHCEHGYTKDGEPYYLCMYIDRDPEHYESIADPDDPGNFSTLYIPVEARSLDELDIKLEIALEDDPNITFNPKKPGMQMHVMKGLLRYCDRRNDADTFWWLLDMLMSDSSLERKFALRRLKELTAEMCGVPFDEETALRSFRDAEKDHYRMLNSKAHTPDRKRFIKYINDAKKKNKDYTANYLCENFLDFSAPTLSRFKTGKQDPTRDQALQICMALQLDNQDRVLFMESAGYYYPVTKKEVYLEYYMENGVQDFYVLKHLIKMKRKIKADVLRSLSAADKSDFEKMVKLADASSWKKKTAKDR